MSLALLASDSLSLGCTCPFVASTARALGPPKLNAVDRAGLAFVRVSYTFHIRDIVFLSSGIRTHQPCTSAMPQAARKEAAASIAEEKPSCFVIPTSNFVTRGEVANFVLGAAMLGVVMPLVSHEMHKLDAMAKQKTHKG